MKLNLLLFTSSLSFSLFDPFYQQGLNAIADETGRLLISLSNSGTYEGQLKKTVGDFGNQLKSEQPSKLLELSLNDTVDAAFADHFDSAFSAILNELNENQKETFNKIGASFSDGLHYIHEIVAGSYDDWTNYAGVARHFSDAFVKIANEAENVPKMWTLAGVNIYQAISFVGLHAEFISFLYMIPIDIRDATLDFREEIIRRFNAEFWDFDPTECIMITDEFWNNGYRAIRFFSSQVVVKGGEYFEELGRLYLENTFIWNTFPTMRDIADKLTRGVAEDHVISKFLNQVSTGAEQLASVYSNLPIVQNLTDVLSTTDDIVDGWDAVSIEEELESTWREIQITIGPFKSIINEQLAMYQTCSAQKQKRIFGN